MNKPDGEIVDYSTDMADGNHVNAYGAKTTEYLCDYIIDRYGITGEPCDEYDESLLSIMHMKMFLSIRWKQILMSI